MDKELIDRAWACLPAEFRKEVKETFARPSENEYEQGYDNALVCCFGAHNLTSDAEGEEMLTVSRKRVQEEYAIISKELPHRDTDAEDYIAWNYAKMTFEELFGSKCLPNEACNIASNVASSGPKFKRGDMVIFKRTGKKKVVFDMDKYGRYIVALPNMQSPLHVYESDLEPYTEPTENKADEIAGKAIKPIEAHFDHIVKGGFREHNRLHIAAMCLQGMLSAGDYSGCPDSAWSELAKIALACADALLVEAQKGGE